MEGTVYLKTQFQHAAAMLPPRIREAAEALTDAQKTQVEEFRLRVSRPFSVVIGGEEETPRRDLTVTGEDLLRLLEIISHGSVHTVTESLKSGFITVAGGHRVGVCGTGTVKDGAVTGFRHISSASLRIAKEIQGVSSSVMPILTPFSNTLIVSPPGYGKTTLLRDIVRVLSYGGRRVSIADERSEIAACERGVPQFDVGPRTDVLDGIPKVDAVMMLLRTMSPDIIAVDEITDPADVLAMERAANCGVRLIATAHAENRKDLSARLFYRKLTRLFSHIVLIEKKGGARVSRVEAMGG
ncbi:Flp pilus assembly complex ATPase component TadA [Oscillospiraceae bacterium OttesenSCG-928-G22]|nr:Flp pilus assembly complex ATPase component TadA [Oscillospiraceae bacterium OttesenSCG-928-G22]